ncbi:NAD(P)H-hydrate epimerase [Achromobacter dolens]|uniref:NAD(P)H-hydrate epimerase n=1 Tax=Achromobacter dolens TaxID=1287738 RepID=UPI0011A303B5|nr:NAD(P)H-hydrate epimerase [Achromobacter dolens]
MPSSHPVARIRAAERQALAEGRRLMPLAGAAAARFVAARVPPGASVLALAGPGNNGGDALVAATDLRQMGFEVRVVMPKGAQGLPVDAARAYAGWIAAGGSTEIALDSQRAPDLVIDGLFGIGLNRPLGADWQALVDQVNGWGVPILALDVPSGLDADTGARLGRPILARWTLSFIARARGLIQPGAALAVGESHVDALGVAIPQAGDGG